MWIERERERERERKDAKRDVSLFGVFFFLGDMELICGGRLVGQLCNVSEKVFRSFFFFLLLTTKSDFYFFCTFFIIPNTRKYEKCFSPKQNNEIIMRLL